MKATKLLCGIAAMALAFAACNKVDQPANESGNFKSIAIKFDNVLTKAFDTQVKGGTAINVKNLQVFFSDGINLYQAKNADNSDATQYFAADALKGAIEKANQTYHFLPSAVNEVIVVANLGSEQDFANKEALENYVVEVSNQQEQDNVALYGSSSDTDNGGSFTQLTAPNHSAQHPDIQVDYYSATVKLLAKVARIEVTGFTYAGSTYQTVDVNNNTITTVSDHRNYESMVVDKIAVANYGKEITFEATSARAFSTADLSTPVKINEYFSTLTSGWMVDTPNVTLNNEDNSFAWTVPSDGEGDAAIAKTYAYTVAPTANSATAVPNICVALRGRVAGEGAQDTPLFLATKALKDGTAALTALQAGKVYRLNFRFDDTDLNLQGKCIDVTVEVADWEVVDVTPDFTVTE